MPLYRKQIIIQVPLDIPDLIKTTADGSDYVSMIDEEETRYRITKANLFAGLSSGTGNGSNSDNSHDLIYSSNGDSNGVFYWLGTLKGTTAWQNPITAGLVNIVMSSVYPTSSYYYGDVAKLVNRVTSLDGIATNNTPGSWVSVSLGLAKLLPTGYLLRGRGANSSEICNWKFQASNDNLSWIDLDSVSDNNLGNSTWYYKAISGQSTSYQWFRVLSTGVDNGGYNILAFDEIELYGKLTT